MAYHHEHHPGNRDSATADDSGKPDDVFPFKQLLPGAANSHDHAFSWTTYHSEELVAYASGHTVVVYHGNQLRQILDGHDHEVTCVVWCKPFAKLAACSKGRVILYEPFKEEISSSAFFTQPSSTLSMSSTSATPTSPNPSMSSSLHDDDNHASQETITTDACRMRRVQWRIEHVINIPLFNAKCMAWNTFGTRLLFGGNECMLWESAELDPGAEEKTWKLVWRESCPNPVSKIEFSPDERLFATLSDHDRLVKVWYRVAKERPPPQSPRCTHSATQALAFSYIYLAHPKAATNFEWHRKDVGVKEFVANVLLTTSRDNVVRIWTETYVNEHLDFYICHAMKRNNVLSAQWLNTPVEICSNDVILRYLPRELKSQPISHEGGHDNWKHMNDDDFYDDDDDDGDNGAHAMRYNFDTFSNNQKNSEPDTNASIVETELGQKRMQNSNSAGFGLFESYSWIFSVERDGSIVVDLVHGLTDYPRRTPKLSTWIRMPCALHFQDTPKSIFAFSDSSNGSGDRSNASDSGHGIGTNEIGYITPHSITIHMHGKIGSIENWIMNLGKNTTPRLSLHNRFTGHRKQVSTVTSHATLPLVASVSASDNHLIVWHVRDTTFYSPKSILTNIRDYRRKLTDVSWFPSVPALFVSTNRGIEILFVKSENPAKADNDASEEIFPPLPSYYNINETGVILQESENDFKGCSFLKAVHSQGIPREDGTVPIRALVVAISQDGMHVGIWQVQNLNTKDAQGSDLFESKLVLHERLSTRATSATCHKSKPFVFDEDPKGKPVAAFGKDHVAQEEGFVILALGMENGIVLAYKIEYSDDDETDDTKTDATPAPAQNAPKLGFGGLLSKFASTTLDSDSDSDSDSDESSDTNDQEKENAAASSKKSNGKLTSDDNGGREMKMVQLLSFQAEDGPVHKISCCHLAIARMATVAQNSSAVHVWEALSHRIPVLEQTIDMSDSGTVTGLAWNTFDDGNYILAVATGQSISCFTEERLHAGETRYWIQYARLQAPSYHGKELSCQSISLTDKKTLVTGFGCRLLVYSKWAVRSACAEQKHKDADTFAWRAIERHNKLPNYHPTFLQNLLMLGKFDLVKEILGYLAKSIRAIDQQNYGMTVRFESQYGESGQFIPSIPIRKLSKRAKINLEENKPTRSTTLLDQYASMTIDDSDSEEDSDEEKEAGNNKHDNDEEEEEVLNFSEAFKILDSSLVKYRLAGLSGFEQIKLVAFINTINEIQAKPDALDDCALRFLVANRYLHFIRKSQKAADPQFSSATFAWALHSETQDTLWEWLNYGRNAEAQRLEWKRDLVYLGVTYWINSSALLREVAEQLAKDQFRANENPTDCALIYVALKKTSTLVGLFRVKKQYKLAEFFQRNFTQEKNKVAACKNAYVLLGRQQFEYAAAFFLIADRPMDAVDILVKRAKDHVLALLILRLYAGDDTEITHTYVRDWMIPFSRKTHDLWLESILYWLIKDYEKSLELLVLGSAEGHSLQEFDPSLYEYCKLIAMKPQLRHLRYVVDNRERILSRVAYYYAQNGALLLAMEYLQKIKEVDKDLEMKNQEFGSDRSNASLFTGEVDMQSFGGIFGGSSSTTATNTINNNDNRESQLGGQRSTADTHSGWINSSAQATRSRDELNSLLKFKLSLSIMAQEMRLISAQPYPTVDKDWDANVKKIRDNLDYLEKEFGIDKRTLVKKLKRFCRFQGLLIAQCMLFSFTSMDAFLYGLQTVSHQVVSLPALIYKALLNPAQITTLERILKEFIYCYRRLTEYERVPLSVSEHADFCATVYSTLFITAWSRRDFDAIYALLAVPQKLRTLTPQLGEQLNKKSGKGTPTRISADKHVDSVNQFCRALSEDLPRFYHAYMRELSDLQGEAEITEKLRQEEMRQGKMSSQRSYMTSEFEPKILNDSRIGSKMSSEEDWLLGRLKTEYHCQQLESQVVFKIASNIKAFIDKNYVTNEHTSNFNIMSVDYSINAQTLILGFSLWCRFLEKRVEDTELEIFTVSSHLPTPTFKDINALLSHSSLTNLADMLSYSRPSIHRGGAGVLPKRFSKRRKVSQLKGQHNQFHSLVHAIPELELHTDTKHQFVKPLVRIRMKNANTFKGIPSAERLWRYLEGISGASGDSSDEQEVMDQADSDTEIDNILSSDVDTVVFSGPIQIVKCKEPIRSFCIDRNNPLILVYATSKGIREVNIEHSILYRKRNPTLDHLLDEEAPTWEESLHRYDEAAAQDALHSTTTMVSSTNMSHIPNHWTFDMVGFLSEMTKTPSGKESGSNGSPSSLVSSSSTPKSPSSIISASSSHAKSPRAHERRRRPHVNALKKLKKRLTMRHRPSFTTHIPPASQFRAGTQPNMNQIEHNQPVSKLVSHPFLPYYLSGGTDGAVRMWQFGFPYSIRTYRDPATSPITNIKFARFGYKFAATDATGILSLWKFSTSKDSTQVIETIKCHSTRANDFSFLDSSSVIGTVGVSGSAKNMCVWDVLLPKYESCLVKESLQEEPLVLTYSSRFRNIIVGGKRGLIKVYDMRMQQFLPTPASMCHMTHVETVSLDISEDFFVTGSADGEVKVWDMRTLNALNSFDDVRIKHKLFDQSAYGVVDSEVTESFLYTGNNDGVISRRVIL